MSDEKTIRRLLYGVWYNMKKRCSDQRAKGYHRYGGRGIMVWEEWWDFEPFYKWSIENGYEESLSIDRIDNDGDYHPGNCRWADAVTQANNRSPRPVPTPKPPLSFRSCEECGSAFTPSRGRQVFCSTPCRRAPIDRAANRGKTILPLALAWRSGRGSKDKSTTTRAFRELCAQLDRYAAEDVKAGRVAPVKKLARQYRHEVRKE